MFEVRATDQAGNTSEPASRSFVVDRTAPSAPGLGASPEGEYVATRDIVFLIDPLEPDVRLECQLDGSAFAACGTTEERAGLAEGPHEFGARAVDDAGNVSPRAAYRFMVDVAPPETKIVSGPPRRSSKRKPTFRFASSEQGVTYECALEKAPFSACESPFRAKVGKGRHQFEVQAIDRAGNVDPEPAGYRFRVTDRR